MPSVVRLFTLIVVCTFASVLSALAGPFSQLVVFGDSLSDTGNFRANNALGIPGPTYDYAPGRFTDGRSTIPAATNYTGVWHEQLAPLLGLPAATPSVNGGFNYAYAAATTVDGAEDYPILPGLTAHILNLGGQVDAYLATSTPPATALFLVWAGGNDLFDDESAANATAAADRLVNNLDVLATAGARWFVVPNLPPLGEVPAYRSNPGALDDATTIFNTELASNLSVFVARYREKGITLHVYAPDVYTTFGALIANPARFGLTNVTQSSQGKAGVNPDTRLFWDTIHPTTKGHQLLSRLFLGVLKSGKAVDVATLPLAGLR